MVPAMIVPLRSYTVLVATICYLPAWKTPPEHVALFTDDLGAVDTYSNGEPVTLRCPTC